MKWIKRFNEELELNTYRRAAYKFDDFNKKKKADKLRDWADLKEHGFYNIHFGNNSTHIVTSTFTQPQLIGIYYRDYSSSLNLRGENLLNKGEEEREEAAQELVNSWTRGGSKLSIKFEFGFKPTNECLSKSNHSYLSNPGKNTSRYLGTTVPIFTIEHLLSEWHDGLEEYDSEAKWHAEREEYEFEPSSADDMYEYTSVNQFVLKTPYDDHYFGIFADRQSAQKFLRIFQKEMERKEVKSSIMDVLSAIQTNYNLEETLNSYKKVRLHGLYYDDKIYSNEIRDAWFGNPRSGGRRLN